MFDIALPPWVVMWSVSTVIFSICKLMTWHGVSAEKAPRWRRIGYSFLWPGMDVHAFLFYSPRDSEWPSCGEFLGAIFKTILGAVLFWIVPRFLPRENELLIGWTGMVGLIFLLHFGAFHVLSCVFRQLGVSAQPLMRAPLAARSLSEFWGRRWNTAFRDLTHRFLFLPLTERIGARWALFVGFVFSGIVHDAVISLPARGGYGLPTLFFVIQGLGLLFEHSRAGRAIGLGKGWRGHVFTLAVLAVPLAGLFHPPFVRNVIVPFMTALHAV